MARAHDRKRQLKQQKAKGKRAQARRERSAHSAPTSLNALVTRAQKAPFGPCWVSAALDDAPDGDGPALISVIVTRRVGGLLLPCYVLVDRTCLGVKSAFVSQPQPDLDVARFVGAAAQNGDPMRPAELLLAQSVIFHAIDYARSLGFQPHPDFVSELIGERPMELLDTPLCRPARPVYINGPSDDVALILAQLEASVGPDGFDFVGMGETLEDGWEDDDLDDDDADDVLTVEGIEAPASVR